MIKRLSMVLMIVFMVVASLGCSQAVEEGVITEDAVTLEPEEAVDVLESGQATEETEIEANLFPAFELKNLDEETLTEVMFSEHELTLVNIWGTTCASCIREMPELEKLQNNYKDEGLKVVGIIADGNYLAGGEIVNALLLTYEHIIPDEDFALGYLSQFQFVPTTLFVNSDGEIIGDPMVGAYDYETFEEAVKNHLGIE
jgi:thiol-disulfide isomerase/thioredoxin